MTHGGEQKQGSGTPGLMVGGEVCEKARVKGFGHLLFCTISIFSM